MRSKKSSNSTPSPSSRFLTRAIRCPWNPLFLSSSLLSSVDALLLMLWLLIWILFPRRKEFAKVIVRDPVKGIILREWDIFDVSVLHPWAPVSNHHCRYHHQILHYWLHPLQVRSPQYHHLYILLRNHPVVHPWYPQFNHLRYRPRCPIPRLKNAIAFVLLSKINMIFFVQIWSKKILLTS